MPKVTDYALVSENDLTEFEQTVGNMIFEGWQPKGSVSTVLDENGLIVYSQAMVR